MPQGDPTVQPAKPGSAKDKVFKELRKKAGMEDKPADPPKPSGAASPGDEATPPGGGTEGQDAPPPSGDPAAQPAAAADPKDGKRQSPWKLVDQFKERAVKAEARVLELEKGAVPEETRKATEAKYAAMEKEVSELRNELRYHNAEKYDPDLIALNKQYETGWKRAIAELSEIPVKDPQTGQTRAATADDLLILVNSPLGQARTIANEVFGDFADDVMAHRKEIRALFDQKSAKLEELKTNAGDRETKRQEAWKQAQGQLNEQIKGQWGKAVEEALANEKHGAMFKPREGDEEWNSRLERGYKMVDEAFSLNPMDAKLTPEQRQEIIRRHVAVRNRAAGFGPLRHAYDKLKAEFEAVKKELDGYKGSAPPAAGRTAATAPASNGSAKDRMWDALGKLAKPE